MSIPPFPTRLTGSAIASRDSRCGAAGSAGARARSIRCRSATRRSGKPTWRPVPPGFVEAAARLGDAGSDRVGKRLRRCCRRRGTTEVETLRAVTTEILHDPLLGTALDSLGHELESERLAEAHDSSEERKILHTTVDLCGEAAVDLYDVDRKTLKIRERCIARAEVVEGELDAAVLQEVELLLGALAARDEHALGQLERQ